MPRKLRRTHQLTDSIFYKLESRARLARLLFCSPSKLSALTDNTNHYRDWTQEKDSGGIRHIEAPDEDLKRIQSRIADLLGRLTPPDFLFNPVKGRSYVGNAARHLGSHEFRMLDVADYFPSCTANRVAWFFGTKMKCSKDVTAILVKITTRNGHLPQGSPCSPALAYLAHLDMWEAIDAEVGRHGCILSLYADDLTISGDHIPAALVRFVKATIYRYGFKLKRSKETCLINSPADITGVIVNRDRLSLPNRQHRKLHDLLTQYRTNHNPSQRQLLARKIAGRRSQKRQIEDSLT